MIGKIERVHLREVWKHEAFDFTKWLEKNIDVLNDVIGRNLTSAESEKSVGAFSLDLLAEDEAGNIVVIENQLERSDHDHLGKLITYLTFLDARTAIWIVSEPRAEHVKAINWLNESSAASFYLIKLQAIKIGDSAPAPLMTLIVGPSEAAQEAGDTKRELADRQKLKLNFWTELLKLALTKTRLHENTAPSTGNWITAYSDIPGVFFAYAVTKCDARVELYIDHDHDTGEGNKKIFDFLYNAKDNIEAEFAAPLRWEKQEDYRSSRVVKDLPTGGYEDMEKWPKQHEEMVNTMIWFEKAISPYLKKLAPTLD